MSWKQDINDFYKGKTEEKTDTESKKAEKRFFIENTVIPAFEEIKDVLSKYASEIRIKKNRDSAKILFRDPVIASDHMTSFGVSCNKAVSFPFVLGEMLSPGRSDSLKIEELKSISKGEIIDRFMKFFNKREDQIQSYQEDMLNVYPL